MSLTLQTWRTGKQSCSLSHQAANYQAEVLKNAIIRFYMADTSTETSVEWRWVVADQPNLIASRIIHELVCTGMERLTSIHWVKDHFVPDHHLKTHTKQTSHNAHTEVIGSGLHKYLHCIFNIYIIFSYT